MPHGESVEREQRDEVGLPAERDRRGHSAATSSAFSIGFAFALASFSALPFFVRLRRRSTAQAFRRVLVQELALHAPPEDGRERVH
jgi:hypothetical protein